MWPKSPEAALTADRTYLRDYAGWVSSIHGVEARALVAAIRQSDDRNLRKALSTRLMQSRMSALLSIGFLYVAVRERFGSSLLQARLRADTTSARMALRGDGEHYVSLDQVIKTMRDTGRDMQDKYKETATGGLAINVLEVPVSIIEC